MSKVIITEEENRAVLTAKKKNKNKQIDKRLEVIKMRYEGKTKREISDITGYSAAWISELCKTFKSEGIDEYISLKYKANNRSLTMQEENEILNRFKNEAEKGRIVSAWEMKKAFDEKLGKDTGRGYIYMLLKRHGWRKVMPRSKHPNKASDEVIEASKKLTLNLRK